LHNAQLENVGQFMTRETCPEP